MKKVFLLFFALQTLLFGCASCALMIPSVELEIHVKMQEKRIEKILFEWHFSDIYTNEVSAQFDKNKNEILDKDERENILNAMLEYLKPKKMLTSIQYADENATEAITLYPKYKNFELKMVDEFLLFTYEATLNEEITPNASLSMAFEDNESYFAFIMSELSVEGSDLAYTKNLYLFTASLLFSEANAMEDVLQEQNSSQKAQMKPNAAPLQTQTQEEESLLREYLEKIKTLFTSIKDEKNPLSYLLLLFFAYVYGVIHAMGPGHGKTLVASYFLANERSYAKAFFISLAIGVVHTFSAFLLTLLIYFVLNTLLAQFLNDTIYYTTKISALIIITIALTLLYKKYRLYRSIQKTTSSLQTQQLRFSTTPHIATCGCASCKVDNNSTDFALIISAGIIPCPGTTTLFIFALSLGLYYAGFIAALVMSLGMSSVIFFSALLSTLVRLKMLKESQTLKKYLEFISLGLIFVLGCVLLFV